MCATFMELQRLWTSLEASKAALLSALEGLLFGESIDMEMLWSHRQLYPTFA